MKKYIQEIVAIIGILTIGFVSWPYLKGHNNSEINNQDNNINSKSVEKKETSTDLSRFILDRNDFYINKIEDVDLVPSYVDNEKIPGIDMVKEYMKKSFIDSSCNKKESPDNCSIGFGYSRSASEHFVTHLLIQDYYDDQSVHSFLTFSSITVDNKGKQYSFLDILNSSAVANYPSNIINIMRDMPIFVYGVDSSSEDYYDFHKDSIYQNYVLKPEVFTNIPFKMKLNGVEFVFDESSGLPHSKSPSTATIPYVIIKEFLRSEYING